MKINTLNIVLIGVIIYLLMQKKNKPMSIEDKLKYAEALGRIKKYKDLGTTF